MHRLFHVLLGAGIAALLALGSARASSALYTDSHLVSHDRFSDEIVGAGPDLIFIPGAASSRATWKATADRLKAHYRLHLIQIAGFAGEPAGANAGGAVLVPVADALDAYLVEQHLTPATIIGHSLGGTITLYLAQHHGDHLRKAMLVDTLPFFATLMAGETATADSMKPMADAMRANPATATSGPSHDQQMASMAMAPADLANIRAWSAASDASVVANAIADDLTLDLRPGLAGITVPITLIYPDYTPLGVPPGATDERYRGAYAAVPHMTFVRADKSLHFIMLDQPAQFDAALDAFLKS